MATIAIPPWKNPQSLLVTSGCPHGHLHAYSTDHSDLSDQWKTNNTFGFQYERKWFSLTLHCFLLAGIAWSFKLNKDVKVFSQRNCGTGTSCQGENPNYWFVNSASTESVISSQLCCNFCAFGGGLWADFWSGRVWYWNWHRHFPKLLHLALSSSLEAFEGEHMRWTLHQTLPEAQRTQLIESVAQITKIKLI